MWQLLLKNLISGDRQALARCISLIENEVENHQHLLESLPAGNSTKVIGITGPPGAGKSTLTDALIGSFIKDGNKIGVLCVDPSSPFNRGALLGDRIRMSEWYTHPNIYIRSLATRGSLGGLSARIIEITDLVKAADFDYIIIETVGIGQSEIEIAGVADTTIVVMTPASGDDIQIMKAGVIEIADIFVVNKSDHPGADLFVKNLITNAGSVSTDGITRIPIIKTIASQKRGIEELKQEILQQLLSQNRDKKFVLLANKAYQLIQQKKMKGVDKKLLTEKIRESYSETFNLYTFIKYFDQAKPFSAIVP